MILALLLLAISIVGMILCRPHEIVIYFPNPNQTKPPEPSLKAPTEQPKESTAPQPKFWN